MICKITVDFIRSKEVNAVARVAAVTRTDVATADAIDVATADVGGENAPACDSALARVSAAEVFRSCPASDVNQRCPASGVSGSALGRAFVLAFGRAFASGLDVSQFGQLGLLFLDQSMRSRYYAPDGALFHTRL